MNLQSGIKDSRIVVKFPAISRRLWGGPRNKTKSLEKEECKPCSVLLLDLNTLPQTTSLIREVDEQWAICAKKCLQKRESKTPETVSDSNMPKSREEETTMADPQVVIKEEPSSPQPEPRYTGNNSEREQSTAQKAENMRNPSEHVIVEVKVEMLESPTKNFSNTKALPKYPGLGFKTLKKRPGVNKDYLIKDLPLDLMDQEYQPPSKTAVVQPRMFSTTPAVRRNSSRVIPVSTAPIQTMPSSSFASTLSTQNQNPLVFPQIVNVDMSKFSNSGTSTTIKTEQPSVPSSPSASISNEMCILQLMNGQKVLLPIETVKQLSATCNVSPFVTPASTPNNIMNMPSISSTNTSNAVPFITPVVQPFTFLGTNLITPTVAPQIVTTGSAGQDLANQIVVIPQTSTQSAPLLWQPNNSQTNVISTPTITQSTVQIPSMQPVVQLATQPVMQQSTQPIVKQSTQPVIQQSTQHVIQQPTYPVFQHSTQPVIQQSAQPGVQHSTQPVIQQSTYSVFQQSTKPVVQHSTKPVVQHSTQHVIQQSTYPVVQQPMQPVVQQSTYPIFQQSAQPFVQQSAQPVIQQSSTQPVIQQSPQYVFQQSMQQPSVKKPTQPAMFASNSTTSSKPVNNTSYLRLADGQLVPIINDPTLLAVNKSSSSVVKTEVGVSTVSYPPHSSLPTTKTVLSTTPHLQSQPSVNPVKYVAVASQSNQGAANQGAQKFLQFPNGSLVPIIEDNVTPINQTPVGFQVTSKNPSQQKHRNPAHAGIRANDLHKIQSVTSKMRTIKPAEAQMTSHSQMTSQVQVPTKSQLVTQNTQIPPSPLVYIPQAVKENAIHSGPRFQESIFQILNTQTDLFQSEEGLNTVEIEGFGKKSAPVILNKSKQKNLSRSDSIDLTKPDGASTTFSGGVVNRNAIRIHTSATKSDSNLRYQTSLHIDSHSNSEEIPSKSGSKRKSVNVERQDFGARKKNRRNAAGGGRRKGYFPVEVIDVDEEDDRKKDAGNDGGPQFMMMTQNVSNPIYRPVLLDSTIEEKGLRLPDSMVM